MQNGYLCLENHNCLCNLALNELPLYIFWKDTDLVYRGCNNNFAKFVGLKKPTEIIDKTDFDLIDKKSAEHFRRIDKKVIKTKKAIINISESAVDTKDKAVWLNVNKVPLIKDGEVIGVLGMFEDVTEKRSLEGKLSKSEEKYKSLIEFTNTSYIIMNKKLKILDVNENFIKIMAETDKNNIVGNNLRTWVCSKQIELFDNAFSCLLKGKKLINDLEISLKNTDGDKIYVSINANLIKNGEEKIFCLVGDISNRKMAQQIEYIKEQKHKERIRKNIIDIKEGLQSLKR